MYCKYSGFLLSLGTYDISSELFNSVDVWGVRIQNKGTYCAYLFTIYFQIPNYHKG